jgi:hypothetical protein
VYEKQDHSDGAPLQSTESTAEFPSEKRAQQQKQDKAARFCPF